MKLDKLDEILYNIVVRIECNSKFGVGFYLDKETLLTAFHVVENYKANNSINILHDESGDNIIIGKVVYFDKNLDVAILKINSDTKITNFLELNSYHISENLEWRSYTCFNSFEKSENLFEKVLIKGKVFQNEKFANKKYDIHLDNKFLDKNYSFEGCSGSPLIIDEYIVGFIIKEESSGRKSTLKVISVEKIKKFLKEKKIKILYRQFAKERQHQITKVGSKTINTNEGTIKSASYFNRYISNINISENKYNFVREKELDSFHNIMKKQDSSLKRKCSLIGMGGDW
jgi:hypothetical protein